MPSTGIWNKNSYNVPLAGETNWSDLSNFLIDLRNNAQTTNFQKMEVRIATSTPVTVSATTDYYVGVNVAGASVVNLPAGVAGQIFVVADESGAAATNNITLDGNASETINGALNYVINRNNGGVMLGYNGTQWRIISESISGGATTGTGNAVLSNNPTFTGLITAANISAILTNSSGDAGLSIESSQMVKVEKGLRGVLKGINLSGNGETITISDAYTVFVSGNGSARTGIILGSSGAVTGQIVNIYANSWGVSFIDSTTANIANGGAISMGNGSGAYEGLIVLWNGSRWQELSRSAANT